jgi:hypothetical protein
MKQFLIYEFGQSLGDKIYKLQQVKLQLILGLTTEKSKNQMKTLEKIILPRISLYKALQEELGEFKKAYDTVEKYMFTIVGPKISRQYSVIEFIPGYFNIFRMIMANVASKSDNWVTEILKNDSKSVEFKITKCLWYDACIENNCPELCKAFCEVDNIIYGSMKTVKFIRKGTIGTGSEFCDFCYMNKKTKNAV